MTMMRLKFNVFGKRVAVERRVDAWRVFYLGDDGTRRPAEDIRIDADIEPDAVRGYLADLCHEWATPAYPDVEQLD